MIEQELRDLNAEADQLLIRETDDYVGFGADGGFLTRVLRVMRLAVEEYYGQIMTLPGEFGRHVEAVFGLLTNPKVGDDPDLLKRVFELMDIIYHAYGIQLDKIEGTFGVVLRSIFSLADRAYHLYYPTTPMKAV